jgi:hypothetical protein
MRAIASKKSAAENRSSERAGASERKIVDMRQAWPKVLYIPPRNANCPHIAMSLALSIGRLLAENHGNDYIPTNPWKCAAALANHRYISWNTA